MRIWQLLCGGLLISNMIGCANSPAPTSPTESSSATSSATTSPVSSAATPSASSSSAATAPGFAALQDVVKSTQAAIESGDLAKAKTEFAKFEDSWKTVEDGVRSKSPAVYRAVEDGEKSIEKGIASKQDKKLLAASLQKLSQNIDKASK
jgi:hypothetical protein